MAKEKPDMSLGYFRYLKNFQAQEGFAGAPDSYSGELEEERVELSGNKEKGEDVFYLRFLRTKAAAIRTIMTTTAAIAA